jgi:heme-degrading monooxygenase HmoA
MEGTTDLRSLVMMTIITSVRLMEDGVTEWDNAMHTRVETARERPGWVSVQLLRGVDDPLERAIVGVWRSKEDWAAWHDDETFHQTRQQLAGLEEEPAVSTWFEVVEAATQQPTS